MDKHVLIHVDLFGKPELVGRLWARKRKGKETATFEYDRNWLARKDRFSLEPALNLGPGPFHAPANKPLFGSFGDSAPDRWGRALMRRAERRRAEREKTSPRALHEIEYLLMVDDEARQGALRFSESEGGPFLAPHGTTKIPPLIELPKLLSAAERVAEDTEEDEDLRLLLAPGSSLGGARPKASVRDLDGHLAIAKFPHKDDEVSQVHWEALALTLAANAGIPTPDWRLESVANKPVLLLRRFDREGVMRIPFLSAMSMLGSADGEPRSYLEIADVIRRHGGAPKEDLRALWRRVVFNILISNTDDHLRNHGFLYQGINGWRLSPAYDLNPVPTYIRPRILTTTIDEYDGTASLGLALKVSEYFDLNVEEARTVAMEVGTSVVRWRSEAINLGISTKEISLLASAFEHKDLENSLQPG
jgi:serine/threonine-protein kinase HipA